MNPLRISAVLFYSSNQLLLKDEIQYFDFPSVAGRPFAITFL